MRVCSMDTSANLKNSHWPKLNRPSIRDCSCGFLRFPFQEYWKISRNLRNCFKKKIMMSKQRCKDISSLKILTPLEAKYLIMIRCLGIIFSVFYVIPLMSIVNCILMDISSSFPRKVHHFSGI